jgi:hypothetical protein
MAKRSNKLIKFSGLVILVVAVLFGIFCGIEYLIYRDGNRAVFFGALDHYSQKQTLKFGSLDLKVTSVTLKSFPVPTPPAQTDCSALKPQDTSDLSELNNTFQYFDCTGNLNIYQNSLSQYQNSNALVVNYQYSKVSNTPINMSDFQLKLIANVPLDDQGCDTPSGLLVKGSKLTACKSSGISKKYTEPLSLIVLHGKQEKTISINLPK